MLIFTVFHTGNWNRFANLRLFGFLRIRELRLGVRRGNGIIPRTLNSFHSFLLEAVRSLHHQQIDSLHVLTLYRPCRCRPRYCSVRGVLIRGAT